MKFSTKSRYGLRAMIELAFHYKEEPVLLKDIAKSQNVSMKYLDRILSPLKAIGLIVRVKNGFILGKSPREINCNEIVGLLEGSFRPVACVDNTSVCNRADECVAIHVWEKVYAALREALGSFTLQDLVDKKKEVDNGS